MTDELAPQDAYYNYRFEKATVLSEPTSALFMEPKARNRLLALGQGMRRSKKRRKIYVSRRSELGMKNGRICVNEEAVEHCLEAYGFEIIAPETLPVIEQIQAFAEADRVVGCSGAGMFNTVFCQPGTKVIEIASRPNWLWGHMNLYNSLGMDYGFVWAVPVLDQTGAVHAPFEVDIDRLRRGLAEQGL